MILLALVHVFLALVHVFAGSLAFSRVSPEPIALVRGWVSMAYVFARLLPELTLDRGAGAAG